MSIFAYYTLDTNQNRQLYQKVREGIGKQVPAIQINGISVQEVNKVLHAVLTDHPDYFWFEGKWSLIIRSGRRYIVPQYVCDCLAVNKIQDGIKRIVQDLNINSLRKLEPYQRVRKVYEWMLLNIEYDMLEKHGQTIYGALIKKKAVCKGLSKTFQFLLEQTDIFSTLREGSLDGISKHVWNVVELEGRYYNVDVSMGYRQFSYMFDENLKNDTYRCFVVSDVQLKKTHRLMDLEQPHLECNDTYWRCQTINSQEIFDKK